jgi:hypothetical protein
MSSHSTHNKDISDLSLRNSLKNWVAGKHPPANSKTRLLSAAAAAQKERPKVSIISGMVYIALNDNFSDLYLQRFKVSPLYSLQPGSLGLNSSKGMV